MSTLTYQQRNKLRSTSFAILSERKYPIHDISHARNALVRVDAYGTQSEIRKVKRAVYRKYPSLKK